MKQRMKRVVLVLCAVMMFIGLLPGCGKKTESDDTLTVFLMGGEYYDGADKDSIWTEIQKKTGVEIEFTGAPYSGYNEKLNLMINTNDVPDIFFYVPQDGSAYSKWVDQGLILNLDDYVKDDSVYPNLYKIIHAPEYRNIKYSGIHTLVPRLEALNNWTIYIRKDWLDHVGLSAPSTLDEFYEVCKAFTEDDPDGNGVDDTYGLGGQKDYYWFMPLYSAWVEKPEWSYNQDKTALEFMSYKPEYKEFLAYISKLYADGFMIKDFYTKNDDQKIEDFTSGKVGILFHNAETYLETIVDRALTINPKAEIDVIANPKGPAGVNMHGWDGMWGGYSISADCKNPEAALKVLDYLSSEDGSMLRLNGIEGVHYTKGEDGMISVSAENEKKREEEPRGRFGEITVEDGTTHLYGNYLLGINFGLYRTFTDGKINVVNDFSNYKYKELALKAQEMSNQYVKVSDMSNIIVDDTEYNNIISKLKDNANTYTINVIVGEKKLDSTWEEYLTKADELGYHKAAEIALNTLKQAEK